MSDAKKPEVGTITWFDLSVPDAAAVKDFYAAVVGWHPEPVSMGDYDDYNMNRPGSGECAAGICHARGPNAALPPQWLLYATVAELDGSLEACRENGGEVISGPTAAGPQGRFAVIRDPAGAAMALFEPPE